MRETEHFYFFWQHQFGQWTTAIMSDPEGRTYRCCEQYMMYQKALLFGDCETAQQILQATEPRQQQHLGRQVKHYDQHQWDTYKLGIVWYANYLKFSQHLDLKERLLATKEKVLVEASPDDLIWGIGYPAHDDQILNPKNWKGKNLLGYTLMSVREAFRLKV